MPQNAPLFQRSDRPLSLGLLVFAQANLLALAAALDPLRAANRLSGRGLYRWQILSPSGGAIPLTTGFEMPSAPLSPRAGYEVLLVHASFGIAAQTTPQLLSVLRAIAPRVAALGGIDGGAWPLARAGLLDGYPATVHREDLEAFANHFPAIDVRSDRVCLSPNRWTCGGAAPCLDMMLSLIAARQGPGLAAEVAGALGYTPPAPTQAQWRAPAALFAAPDPVVTAATQLMEEEMETAPTIAALAARLGVSTSQLEDRFRAALSTTPAAHFRTLRLAEARRLAADTTIPFGEIAVRAGFSGQAVLARAIRRQYATTLSAIRAGAASDQ